MPSKLSPVVFGGASTVMDESVSAIFVLTPTESKKLIAKGVAALPQVKKALKKGRVVIATGTTNAFVAEEILGHPIPRDRFLTGHITDGLLSAMVGNNINPFVLVNGEVVDISPGTILPEFEGTDVFIKGANAIDPEGYAGIIMTNEEGGTIGKALGILAARGANLIVPVGLEKMIPSVPEAARRMGTRRIKYGLKSENVRGPAGMMPLVGATVVTELVALNLLTGVQGTHVGSGGINGSEGSVVIVVEGTEEQVAKAMELVNLIKQSD